MTRLDAFALGLGLGALVCPIAYVTTMRLSGRHELDPTRHPSRPEETP